MFINANSIIISGGGRTINGGDYIVEAKYGYHKLWAQDSGRNLAGTQTGTLIGIFPKITLQFKRLKKSQLETLSKILDSATQQFTYYDPNKEQSVTMETYTGDYEVINKYFVDNYDDKKNEGFSCSFIAISKRS